MLNRTRSSTAVRLALGVAAILSVVASFGLHPEPEGPSPSAAGLSIAAAGPASSAPHDCPACVTCATALAASRLGAVARSTSNTPLVPASAVLAPARHGARDLSGRSPPACA